MQVSMKLDNVILKTPNHHIYIIMVSTPHDIDNACIDRMNNNGLKH